MEYDSQQSDNGYVINSPLHLSDQHEARCVVCRCSFSPENEERDFYGFSICRVCKNVMDDFHDSDHSMSIIRDFGQSNRQRRRRIGSGSTESVEDVFSQQFTQRISLAGQAHEAQNEGDSAPSGHRPSRYTYRRRSRRWRAASDNDSDSVDYVDSLLGESDSIISFGGNGGESEASFDRFSFREREAFVQLDDEIQPFTDTDIDPMHVGLDQWDSDGQGEEEAEWEEPDDDEVAGPIQDSASFGYPSPTIENTTSVGLPSSTRLHWAMRRDSRPLRSFEELREQLAETGSSRGGMIFAARERAISNLPRVIISNEQEGDGGLLCAVCMDPLAADTEARRLPCLHLYHPNCILPWLKERNSCPVCRYVLPAYDREYEEAKWSSVWPRPSDAPRQQAADGYGSSSDSSNADPREFTIVAAPDGYGYGDPPDPPRISSGGKWIFLVAAPIVAIVGSVLVMWFQSTPGGGSSSDGRIHRASHERRSSRRWLLL